MKKVFLILLSLLIVSCGKTTDQETQDAILSASISLSKGNCQNAINTLEEHGRVNDNASYLKTLASAYACRAGYSTVAFFSTDLAVSATPAPLGGTTLYTTSTISMTSPLQNDTSFRDLQIAIDILLYAGGIDSATEPTATERAKYFTTDEAGEINSQLMYMIFVQLGKYLKVYGNASAVGVKGGGTAGNNCLTSYGNITDPEVLAALAAMPGSCKVANSPHSELTTAVAATRKTRLCHGVVLINSLFDVFPSVIASATGGSLGAVSGVSALITALRAAVTAADPAIGIVNTTMNQNICEDNTNVPVDKIEEFFVMYLESIFQ